MYIRTHACLTARRLGRGRLSAHYLHGAPCATKASFTVSLIEELFSTLNVPTMSTDAGNRDNSLERAFRPYQRFGYLCPNALRHCACRVIYAGSTALTTKLLRALLLYHERLIATLSYTYSRNLFFQMLVYTGFLIPFCPFTLFTTILGGVVKGASCHTL